MNDDYYVRDCTGEQVLSSTCEWFCCKNCPNIYACKDKCSKVDICDD